VDGFTISGLPVVSGSYVGTNPIWGDVGSPNAQDWLQVDLGAPTRFNSIKLYFYSNKSFGSGGNTYREPADYTVQYFDGTSWVDVPGQGRVPATPAPNYNEDDFPPTTAQLVRVPMTRQTGYGVGVKELQVFDTPTLSLGPGRTGPANRRSRPARRPPVSATRARGSGNTHRSRTSAPPRVAPTSPTTSTAPSRGRTAAAGPATRC
jgi:hypothetical protein